MRSKPSNREESDAGPSVSRSDRTDADARFSKVLLVLFIGSLLLLCWLSMQVVHELGHVLAAWVTGGRIKALVLHPLVISRTDVSPNPEALVVVWGGPIVGTIGPLVVWSVVRWLHLSSAYLWRFFAGFCCVANGVYLGTGVVYPVGDASEMLRLGSSVWVLGVFGSVATVIGFVLWNGEGERFGLGPRGRAIDRNHVAGVVTLLVLVVITELVWSGWG